MKINYLQTMRFGRFADEICKKKEKSIRKIKNHGIPGTISAEREGFYPHPITFYSSTKILAMMFKSILLAQGLGTVVRL